LVDRRNDGETSYNSGDGTGQKAQSLAFIMMIIYLLCSYVLFNSAVSSSNYVLLNDIKNQEIMKWGIYDCEVAMAKYEAIYHNL
jgi:hypothetical protein